MLRKIRNIIGMFLSLTLIITNMAIITNSFAKTDDLEDTNSVEETNSMKERDLKEYISIKKKKCGNSKPNKVENLQVSNRSYNYIKIQWSQVKSSDGYIIFRSNIQNGDYEKVGEVDSKTLSFIDEDLQCGSTYYYRVKAYNKKGKNIYFSDNSVILDTTTCPEIVKYIETSATSDCSIELSWQTVCKCSGYEIYRSNNKDGNYTKIATLTENEKSCFTDKNLKSNEKYYYKVRAFKELNGEICFGQYSHILCVYTKK